jgi:3D (Asp-Asp-Asp) domain-containing protein
MQSNNTSLLPSRARLFGLLVAIAAPLAACTGNVGDEGGSTHGRAPTPASAWADEAAPAEVAATKAEARDVDAEEDGVEDPQAEDPGAAGGQDAAEDGDVAQTAAALTTTTGTPFKFTYYWVAVRPSGDANQTTLRQCGGEFLSYASFAWRDAVQMEMTGRFTKSDGTKVTFNDWGGCWKILDAFYDWGVGVQSPITKKPYKLRPFRSIAVDSSVLKIGKWYYIKELDGLKMPSPRSTMTHNGCVRAVDTGWSFSGKHVDFFAGMKSAYEKLALGSGPLAGKTSVTVFDGAAKCQVHIERGY